ncbi:MAG: hypothetical protein HQK96_04135 [Nitrospirae bacterium]|nr:hypothetical protein [Nitrospirota bacterium]
MSVDVEKNSRLRVFTLSVIGGVEFWSDDSLPDLSQDDSDNSAKYTEYDLIDVIAFKAYMDEILWWGVALVNMFWNALRSLEEYKVTWVDKNGFSNTCIVYGDEMASDNVEYLVSTGVDSATIKKERVFDIIRVASSRRMFGIIK